MNTYSSLFKAGIFWYMILVQKQRALTRAQRMPSGLPGSLGLNLPTDQLENALLS